MSATRKVTPSSLLGKKRRGEKISLLTAYDYPMARSINQAGVDIILVSDAVGTVGNGRSEAISVSIEEMIYHTQAVRNGAGNSMVVTTLPFGSYEKNEQAVQTAVRLMKEGGADAVHFEGTSAQADHVKAIVGAGIPVLGHIGIIKQKIVRSGMFQIQGRTAESAQQIFADVVAFSNAGAFGLVLECIPTRLGEIISQSLEIPTIGIGAGSKCDGQALVTQDMLGLYKELSPRFLKVYLDLNEIIVSALTRFRTEVEQGQFPGPEHSYEIKEEELGKLLTQLQSNLTY
ncbi:MAG TPA: 3-methyl-2-oxobutanoate hydroxymethyltransferase [Patescibacteria group bacterium]|jgi:3-methyl-2-oxobutanoate hydroxymethyltransferase|nr:3-methyl-2-oxobutanoate hydroxymethyltransferase [Patescibacteria group bacterium]